MNHPDENRHEHAAREEKAHKLADYARSHGLTSEHLAVATDDQWEEMAFLAKVNAPSAETRKRVIQLSAAEETFEVVGDPFEGL